MPSKKVTISAKPQERTADEWVKSGDRNSAADSPMGTGELPPNAVADSNSVLLKRLTIDIPEELHARIKSQCALRRTKMADEIRVLLENHFSR